MKRIIAIGEEKTLEQLWKILERAEECFDLQTVFLLDPKETGSFFTDKCNVAAFSDILQADKSEYDEIYVCGRFQKKVTEILISLWGSGYVQERLRNQETAWLLMSAENRMKMREKELRNQFQKQSELQAISIGAFTYGKPTIRV